MRNFVFIASHISVSIRVQTLDITIQSILNQTLPAHTVFISVSSNTEYTPLLNTMLSKYEANSYISVSYSPVKLSQGKHIERIVRENTRYFLDNDLIHFCDDDDLYCPDRIQEMYQAVLNNPDKQMYRCDSTSMTDVTSMSVTPEVRQTHGNSIFAEHTVYFRVLDAFLHTQAHRDTCTLSIWDIVLSIYTNTRHTLKKALCIQRKDMYNQLGLDNITKSQRYRDDMAILSDTLSKPGIFDTISE